MIRLLLFVLMPAGFIGSAWVTNSLFSYLKKDAYDVNTTQRFGTLVVLLAIFSAYCYFICHIFGLSPHGG